MTVSQRRNDDFDEMLDECYDDVKICGCTYTASDVLFSCDPIAYNQGLLEYEDSLEGRGEE